MVKSNTLMVEKIQIRKALGVSLDGIFFFLLHVCEARGGFFKLFVFAVLKKYFSCTMNEKLSDLNQISSKTCQKPRWKNSVQRIERVDGFLALVERELLDTPDLDSLYANIF